MEEYKIPKLYKLKFINQMTGGVIERYVLARDMLHIESEYADIVSVLPLTSFDNLIWLDEQEVLLEEKDAKDRLNSKE